MILATGSCQYQMPLLSPPIKQLFSPDVIQPVSARTKAISSFNGRLPDKGEEHFTVNGQMSISNSGKVLAPNNMTQSAHFGNDLGYGTEQLPCPAEATRARQLSNMDQSYQGLQVAPNNQSLIQGKWPPTSNGSLKNVLAPAMNISPDFNGHLTSTYMNGIFSRSEALPAPIQSKEATQGQFVHGTNFGLYCDPKIIPNQMLNTSSSESRFQVMSQEFQNAGAILEQNQEKNCGQRSNGLPVCDLKTLQHTHLNMGRATENRSVKCARNSISPGALSESDDVIVTKVTSHVTYNQTSTAIFPKHQEDHVPGPLQYNVSGNTTHSEPLDQHVESKSLGQGVTSRPLLCQQKSGFQEHQNDSDVQQLPSPELLQTMMANNSPSKYVVMKMCGGDKYVILSPEKSSSLEMVYKPMGSMKLPPGKYRLHTMNANASALSATSDKGQITQLNINATSPCKVAQKTPKTGEKISKKKSSIKISSAKEKKECKKERKRKQQPTKETGTKKAKNKVEKKVDPLKKKPAVNNKKPSAKDKKPKAQGKKSTEQDKKSTEQDKKSKSKPKKAKDPKDSNSKEKKKKKKSQLVEKKTEEKKEDTKYRILTPCQKFCRTVLISHNKAGRLVHTVSDPAIFFTGGQFLASQDTVEVEHPVFLLMSDNDKILAIMSEAFNPGQYLLTSKQRIILKDEVLMSDLHDADARKQPLKFILYRAVLSPYNFSVSSPIKGHKILLLGQYQDVLNVTSTTPTDGSGLLEDTVASYRLISDLVDTWDQSHVTTLAPCTHPLYETMKEMLKNKIDNPCPPKTCKYKLKIQLFDSRRKKQPKIIDDL